jgi:hypothetical protein
MSVLSLSETMLVPTSLVNSWGSTFFKYPLNPSAIFLQTFNVCHGLSVNSSVEQHMAIPLCHSRFSLLFAIFR